jgi:hypothetical protein
VKLSVANSLKDLPANFAKKCGRWEKNSTPSYKQIANNVFYGWMDMDGHFYTVLKSLVG